MTDRSFLIDTHIVIWWLEKNAALNPFARDILADRLNDVFVSAAVPWEMAIKSAKGRLETPANLAEVLQAEGFIPLPISHAHAQAVGNLPPIHHDPFDRIQLAQASHNGLTFITADKINLSYPHIAMMEGA